MSRSKDAGEDEAASDLKELGATDDQVAEILGGDGDAEEPFELWPDNEPALRVFLRCRRCWRTGPLGGVLGLDYPQVIAVMREMKIKNRDELLQDLDAMADAVVKVWNRKD